MLTQESQTWYSDAKKYWDSVDSNIQGMLGGYGSLTDTDAIGNTQFIKSFPMKLSRACDCGAGIGRVSRTFLLKHFERVDLVEQTEKFLEQARSEFKELGLAHRCEFIPIGLQDFNPQKGEYDLIWCQWVLSHLTDKDLVEFLKRCKNSMDGGYIGIKENVCRAGIEYDSQDSSCTRSDYLWKQLFDEAGLSLLKEQVQESFPDNIYPVKMYMLK